ncbi:MAG: SDR family oxidoreductase [Planctomycetota bacterium]|nr:SDR family oxidoreductase [Planctomycetota bacterium]
MSDKGLTIDDGIEGRVALVTGASSGIGRGIALALGARKARVVVHFRSSEAKADAVVRLIQASGGEAIALQADLATSDGVDQLFNKVDRAFANHLDFVVNNAGEWMDAVTIAECTESQWDHMFNVNAKSMFLCCRAAAQRMLPKKHGSIVNMGSVAGHTGGGGGTVPYCAAKAAIHTLTRGLARELAAANIRVNAVAPGVIETDMTAGRVSDAMRARIIAGTPLGRFGEADEIAAMVLTLLGNGGSYITGQVIDVNGGLLMR